MSTDSNDGGRTETTPDAKAGVQVPDAPGQAREEHPGEGGGDLAEDAGRPDEEIEDTEEAEAPTGPPGALSTETFGIAGLLALLGSLIGTRLVELLASSTAASQEGAMKAIALGDGVFALVAVALSAAGLTAASPDTRPWARWLSTAVLLVGVLLVAAAVAAYLMVPPPAPPQPMIPGM
ncbi:hypothetical protein [Nocardiopsis composta]|uniref:Uncharacterized protein n=1 Tax=Nocardiopsis composta TaxID=157465 RepID=A0A7W8VDP5_9ACTN|nr:hypothetical protein [Nocardiopsis composta]MBB5432233.1 hypothetical protein [Nocardiopsis composta]